MSSSMPMKMLRIAKAHGTRCACFASHGLRYDTVSLAHQATLRRLVLTVHAPLDIYVYAKHRASASILSSELVVVVVVEPVVVVALFSIPLQIRPMNRAVVQPSLSSANQGQARISLSIFVSFSNLELLKRRWQNEMEHKPQTLLHVVMCCFLSRPITDVEGANIEYPTDVLNIWHPLLTASFDVPPNQSIIQELRSSRRAK